MEDGGNYLLRRLPPLQGGSIPLAFGLPPVGLEGRRFDGQANHLLYFRPNLEVLCRTSISKGALAYRYSQYVR